jgi:hypothetical protein
MIDQYKKDNWEQIKKSKSKMVSLIIIQYLHDLLLASQTLFLEFHSHKM